MSSLQIFSFDKHGHASHEADARNSWGGAMHIWSSLSQKYGYPPMSMMDRGDVEIWKACSDGKLNDDDTIVCKFTFDHVVVAKKNIPRLVDALQSFCGEFVDGKDIAQTLPETIATLRGLAGRDDVTAVAFNQTSVNCAEWSMAIECSECSCTCEGEQRGYDLTKDEGHWELFGDTLDAAEFLPVATEETAPRKHRFVGSGYSDDCGGLGGATLEDGSEPDESEMCHAWYEMLVDGKVVGRCQMNYDFGGWQFIYEGDVEIRAGKLLERPEHWGD